MIYNTHTGTHPKTFTQDYVSVNHSFTHSRDLHAIYIYIWLLTLKHTTLVSYFFLISDVLEETFVLRSTLD
jgi:hypothetical protein